MKKLILGFVACAALFGMVNRADAWAKDEETIFSLNNRTNGRVFEISGMSGRTTVTVDGVISASSINYSSTNSTYAEVNAGILTVTTSATIQAATSPGTISANALSSSTTVTGTRSVFGNGSVTGGSTNAGVFVAGAFSTTGTVTITGVTTLTGDTTGQDVTAGSLTVSTNAAVTGTTTLTGDLATQDATVGKISVTTSATFSATSGRILLGTNIGVSAEVLIGTGKVNIVNGIITQYGY